jgi:hypothetical protein
MSIWIIRIKDEIIKISTLRYIFLSYKSFEYHINIFYKALFKTLQIYPKTLHSETIKINKTKRPYLFSTRARKSLLTR